MVDSIGQGTSLARTAIEAALKRQAEATARMAHVADAAAPKVAESPKSDFSKALLQGISEVDSDVKHADALVDDMLSGKVKDFHEVAAALKQSELSFKFALEVRSKFVDAYREVMRMSV